MESPPPFFAPRLKAEWGAQRTRELADAIRLFKDAPPYNLVSDQSGAAQVAFLGAYPSHIPLILGDAIHNLRTALDLLACDVVRLNKQSAKGVYFPFADSEAGLAEMIVRKKFSRASEDAQRLLKTIQPYRGGNELLRALHDLDVMDKHQLIIPMGSQSRVKSFVVRGDSASVVMKEGVTISSGVYVSGGRNTKVLESKIDTHILFAGTAPSPLSGRDVFGTLAEIAAFESLGRGWITAEIPRLDQSSFGGVKGGI